MWTAVCVCVCVGVAGAGAAYRRLLRGDVAPAATTDEPGQRPARPCPPAGRQLRRLAVDHRRRLSPPCRARGRRLEAAGPSSQRAPGAANTRALPRHGEHRALSVLGRRRALHRRTVPRLRPRKIYCRLAVSFDHGFPVLLLDSIHFYHYFLSFSGHLVLQNAVRLPWRPVRQMSLILAAFIVHRLSKDTVEVS